MGTKDQLLADLKRTNEATDLLTENIASKEVTIKKQHKEAGIDQDSLRISLSSYCFAYRDELEAQRKRIEEKLRNLKEANEK